MKTPYLTIPFSLSQESLQWIKAKTDPMVENYQKNAPLDAALIEFPSEEMQDWYDSNAWKEILKQLSPFGFQTEPLIQFFIYKKLDKAKGDPRGNPHIDTYQGVDGTVPIRFNILLDGDENQEMVWWDINDFTNDNRLHVVEFPRPNAPKGTMSRRVQVRGEKMEDRWETAGEPEYRCSNLAKINEYASFVRTDTLHAINWDGRKPRLIMSVRYKDSWDLIEKFIE